MVSRLRKPEIRSMDRDELNKYGLKIQAEYKRMLDTQNRKIDVLQNRVRRKDELINRLKYQVFQSNRRIYAIKLRTSKEKSRIKKEVFERVVNNVVNNKKELVDIPKYHMALFELSQAFGLKEMVIILLLWASRYEFYSKKEFKNNFKNSTLKFETYNNALVREGYANKWDLKRSTYFISASGKELVEKINKFVNNRMNG